MPFRVPRPATRRPTGDWIAFLEGHARSLRCAEALRGLENGAESAEGWPPAPTAAGYTGGFASRFWSKMLYHLRAISIAQLRVIATDAHEQEPKAGCTPAVLRSHLALLRRLLQHGGVNCPDEEDLAATPYGLAVRTQSLCDQPRSDRSQVIESLVGKGTLPRDADALTKATLARIVRQLICSTARSMRAVLSTREWPDDDVIRRMNLLTQLSYLMAKLV